MKLESERDGDIRHESGFDDVFMLCNVLCIVRSVGRGKFFEALVG